MGVLPFLKVSLKNRPSSCRPFLEESHCACCASFALALVCPAVVDLARFVAVDIVADALPLLLIPRWMLGHWLVRWRMLCRRVVCWRTLLSPLSLASSLADALLPRVIWPFPHYRCFVVVGVFASSPVDAWPLVGSLVDALPPLLLDGLLCRRPLRCCILFSYRLSS
jgi:hypothetical protein